MTSPKRSRRSLVRPLVRGLHAYTPGEQPKIPGLIKLNTNENPYPPAPAVLRKVRLAVDGRLRLYPNPTAEALRAQLAALHGGTPDHLIVGNGSDELLALAVRCFVEPAGAQPDSASTVQFFAPSYSLYPVLAQIHGAACRAVPLPPDFSLPGVPALRRAGQYDFNAALTLVTTPNAPSGRGYATQDLDRLCAATRGVLVLDEAYVDFAEEQALELALRHPHVLVARTFSKAYSLCFQRVGYFVGHPDLIAALQKIRDSYNVNGLGQIAAQATLEHLPYYRRNFARIIQTREKLSRALAARGFRVLPSSTNFLLAQPPAPDAGTWLEALRARKILVRWFKNSPVEAYLRITIGTPAEAQALLRAVDDFHPQGVPNPRAR
ncbi:MAG: histidinol-phosphate transaminase [Verrucomicrobiales bacterium]|nr:histidinol-phosphate transaminase [Verrucomicrobiales bacterium]